MDTPPATPQDCPKLKNLLMAPKKELEFENFRIKTENPVFEEDWTTRKMRNAPYTVRTEQLVYKNSYNHQTTQNFGTQTPKIEIFEPNFCSPNSQICSPNWNFSNHHSNSWNYSNSNQYPDIKPNPEYFQM
ncbi:hypothetical protein B9Z55_021626 [Caenorhabditis nigoni]|nr:hypothetical protein B9Z55_021626 [Caenorhabditis nigoni]